MVFLSVFFIFLGPLLGVLFSFLKKRDLRDLLLIASSLLTPIGMFFLFWLGTKSGLKVMISLGNISTGINFAFSTGRLGMFFGFLISALYPIAMVYTTAYLKAKPHHNESSFLAFLNVAIIGGLGVAFADNLLVLFMFYELITASTYPLIVSTQNNSSRSAGRYYLFHLLAPSALLILPVMAFIYQENGTLTFFTGGIIRGTDFSAEAINIMFYALLFGFAKTAIFPLHTWLLKAMVAPAPVSAILHAVIVVKSGVFAMIVICYKIFGPDVLETYLWRIFNINLFTWIALFTIFFAGIKTLIKDNLKERLAYSTISQASYILLMVSLFNETSLKAAMVQFATHSFAKITLFFAAGGLYILNNSYDISKITKVWERSSIVATSVLLGCLAILGFPPTIGFYAKYNMFIATFSENNLFIGILIIIATVLSACYLISLLYHVFFVPNTDTKKTNIKLPIGIPASLFVLSLLLMASSGAIDYLFFTLIE